MRNRMRRLFGQEAHTFDIVIPFCIKERRWYIPEFNPLWWLIYIIGVSLMTVIIYWMLVGILMGR